MGDSFQPKKFSTWCAQIIAGIGSQRGTLHDRSIHIELVRALPGKKPAKLPGRYFEEMKTVRQKCLRWAIDNQEMIDRTEVKVPHCGNDRAEDNWQPLFILATMASGIWLDRVLSAYHIFTQSANDGEESASHMLIEDISGIIENWAYPHIFSKTLVEKLIDLEERPWCEWRRGKPLTQNSLSKLLKPYHLVSNAKRIGSEVAKGYEVEALKVAFMPYVPTLGGSSVTRLQPAPDQRKSVTLGESVTVQSVTNVQSVTQKANKHKACNGVTVKTTQIETPYADDGEVLKI